MTARSRWGAASAVFLTACGTTLPPDIPTTHPAHPHAAESPVPVPTTTLALATTPAPTSDK